MIQNFNQTCWGNNGLMTRLLQLLCNATKTSEMIEKGNCHGFNALPIDVFYPIRVIKFPKLFLNSTVKAAMESMKYSYFIHTWSAVSKKFL
ncbi:CLUMA_CG015604, isoform A [Clunio marinus]|uniref:CLUMA_CG015604, isoform A n=1 Tax=Clunio marinus TaxID=568069 RepID=A0A1J1IRJ8_9DIPT|nr:CLUMA_CG015604, isoform A [Clunio marinus]